MTTQQLIDKARLILGDGTGAYWGDEELDGYLSDGVEDIAKKTKMFQGEEEIVTTSTQRNYQLQAERVLSIIEIFDETHSIPIRVKSYGLRRLENARRDDIFIDSSLNLILPYPFDGVIKVRYAYVPQPYTDAIENLLPDWAAGSLVDYIVYRAYTVDRAEQNLQKAQFHQLRYEGEVRRLRELAFKGYNSQPTTIAYQGF